MSSARVCAHPCVSMCVHWCTHGIAHAFQRVRISIVLILNWHLASAKQSALKSQVSFAAYRLLYRALLQKRPITFRSLLIVATPYHSTHVVIVKKMQSFYRVAKTYRIPYLYRSFSAKVTYIWWLFCGKWSATQGIRWVFATLYLPVSLTKHIFLVALWLSECFWKCQPHHNYSSPPTLPSSPLSHTFSLFAPTPHAPSDYRTEGSNSLPQSSQSCDPPGVGVVWVWARCGCGSACVGVDASVDGSLGGAVLVALWVVLWVVVWEWECIRSVGGSVRVRVYTNAHRCFWILAPIYSIWMMCWVYVYVYCGCARYICFVCIRTHACIYVFILIDYVLWSNKNNINHYVCIYTYEYIHIYIHWCIVHSR